MKFNKLAGLGIASILLFGSVVGVSSLNTSAAEAQRAEQSIKVAAKSQSLISSGNFVTADRDHPTRGMAKIVSVDGKRYLELSQGFSTARGPKVKVLLHRKSNVPVKLRKQNYVTLANLKNFNGAQRYEIPDSFNLDDFESVAIWCERFNVTFGYARLQNA